MNQISVCWAKYDPEGDPPRHPLICHMIDVAQVARRMWTSAFSSEPEARDVQGAGVR